MTEYHYFKGIAGYNRPYQPDQYDNYVFQIKLDDEEVEKYKDTGIQVRVDDDNRIYFRRPATKLINKELVELGPPKVVDTDGNPINDLIGAGSEVVVKVRSYNTQKGIGHTLDAVQVIDLVPVEGGRGEYNF